VVLSGYAVFGGEIQRSRTNATAVVYGSHRERRLS
jgi:hypothetical protein